MSHQQIWTHILYVHNEANTLKTNVLYNSKNVYSSLSPD